MYKILFMVILPLVLSQNQHTSIHVDEFMGNIYFFNSTTARFPAHKRSCEENGRQLVMIRSKMEEDYVFGHMKTDSYIGAECSNDTWYFMDGTKMEYKNFSPESKGYTGCYTTGYGPGMTKSRKQWFGLAGAGAVCVDYNQTGIIEKYNNLSVTGLQNFNQTLEMIQELKQQQEAQIVSIFNQIENLNYNLQQVFQRVSTASPSSVFSSFIMIIFIMTILGGLIYAIYYANQKFNLLPQIIEKIQQKKQQVLHRKEDDFTNLII